MCMLINIQGFLLEGYMTYKLYIKGIVCFLSITKEYFMKTVKRKGYFSFVFPQNVEVNEIISLKIKF